MPISRAATGGMASGNAVKPGLKIAASQSRKSRLAGSKKFTRAVAAARGKQQRMAKPPSMPIMEAGNCTFSAASVRRSAACKTTNTAVGAMGLRGSGTWKRGGGGTDAERSAGSERERGVVVKCSGARGAGGTSAAAVNMCSVQKSSIFALCATKKKAVGG